MRELKFRAWDKDEGSMVLFSDVHSEGVCLMLSFEGNLLDMAYERCDLEGPVNERYELMQHTGLKDDFDNDIYEGDILRICDYNNDPEIGKYVVVYCAGNDYPAFDLKPYLSEELNGLSYAKAECRIAVIGNVYEHPHLIPKGGEVAVG